MYKVIRAEELQLRPGGTVKFEGALYGSGVSFFHVHAEPGKGANLHVHPYPETWIVRDGKVCFTVGGEEIVANPGEIVVAAANVPHNFSTLALGH